MEAYWQSQSIITFTKNVRAELKIMYLAFISYNWSRK